MIADWESNKVYFSEIFLKDFPEEYGLIVQALSANGISIHILSQTNDIWCRDYMPVQIDDNKFVRFNYAPSYLKAKRYRHLRTDNDLVCKQHGINAISSAIVLDGGNVVKSKTKAIVTDKVFDENPDMLPEALLQELEALFGCEVIIIPHHADDYTGHADGMVRFIDETTVLVNDLSKELPSFRYQITQVLARNGLAYKEMPFFLGKNAIGCYINYLQTQSCILVPAFGRAEDVAAISLLRNTFSQTAIIPIESTHIASLDGVLNCVSWNIRV